MIFERNVNKSEQDEPIDYVAALLGYSPEFEIEGIYNGFHNKYVQELLLQHQIYNEAYLQQLSICDKPIFHSKSEIESALIPSNVEVGNKLLGK